jgi:pyruvate formate lyase activating enzyme
MGGEIVLDRHACKLSFNCIDACPSGALLRYGRELSVSEVLEEVARDEAFYQRSGGGITLSGGEPLNQADFSFDILNECRRKGYHTVLDTSGHGDWEHLLRLITTCDLVFYDIKHMDPEKHRLFTGVDNCQILENARRATRYGVPFVVRFPLIPGINNDARNLRAIADFVTELRTVERIDLLPFHRLGQPKHEELGRHWPMGEEQMPSAEEIEYARNILMTSGVQVAI